jgi:uncharacterized protein YyaL (SSP411 family)
MAPASRWYANRPLANLAVTAGRDADGVTIKLIEGRAYYHPVNMADQGLQLVDSFRKTGEVAYLSRARKVAARLRTEATLVGGALYYPYRFDVDWESHGRKLAAPWYSAMAQGEALSFLVAMHEITGEERYLTWATQTFRSLARPFPARPWVTYADRSGNLWFEEYPLQPAEHVLNGNIFALFGLADYVGLTGNAEARRLLQGGLTTVERLGPRYRHAGSYSSYGIWDHTRSAHYHAVHIFQLRYLTRLTGDRAFADLADQMLADRAVAPWRTQPTGSGGWPKLGPSPSPSPSPTPTPSPSPSPTPSPSPSPSPSPTPTPTPPLSPSPPPSPSP